MVVAQTDVDYKLPILFRPEPYDAWSWISRVGERSMTIESEICDGEAVLSRARVVMVFFDPRQPGRRRRRTPTGRGCSGWSPADLHERRSRLCARRRAPTN